jgi:hypothetical protein
VKAGPLSMACTALCPIRCYSLTTAVRTSNPTQEYNQLDKRCSTINSTEKKGEPYIFLNTVSYVAFRVISRQPGVSEEHLSSIFIVEEETRQQARRNTNWTLWTVLFFIYLKNMTMKNVPKLRKCFI